MKNKKKMLLSILLALVIVIGSTGYYFADKYLIEHVEKTVTTISTTSSTKLASNTVSASDSSKTTNNIGDSSSSDTTDTGTSSTASTSVNVKKVITGTGDNTVTYYVANVTIGGGSDIKTAFAKNSFGTNIIEYTSTIAANNNATFAINGDYYGFRDDGIIIRNGEIYRDVPARTGLAIYKDGTMKIYDETKTTAAQLIKDGVLNTFSFGPALLANGQVIDGIDTVEIDTNFGNHSIQGDQPRTAIGMIDATHYVFVVVDGRSTGYSKGVILTELAAIFKDLGCQTAYNIDGGGSSVMYYNGQVVSNPLGKNQERGTSDIIYIR